MSDVPIMFKDKMYDDVVAGRKTATRRIPKRRNGVITERWHKGDLLYVKEKTDEQPNKMFMPKRLATVWLLVTGVYLEPLWDMTDDDARAEGFLDLVAFSRLWDQMYGKTEHDWNADPLVWVIVFERTERP